MGGVSKSHVGKRANAMGGAWVWSNSSHAPIKASLQDEASMVSFVLLFPVAQFKIHQTVKLEFY